MMGKGRTLNVIIVGGGPVGLLSAIYASQRGHNVEVLELRPDPRSQTSCPNQGKSLQLTLTTRGMRALSGFEELLADVTIRAMPVRGRLVHKKGHGGELCPTEHLYGKTAQQVLHCIGRQDLQNALLEAITRIENITISFDSKVKEIDCTSNTVCFQRIGDDETQTIRTYDLLIGADGAHSVVRRTLVQQYRLEEEETQTDCIWTEFTGSVSCNRASLSSPDHLHIWPSKMSMFIAMPRSTGDFVSIWFAPINLYQRLDKLNDEDVLVLVEDLHPGIFHQIDPSSFVRQIRSGSRQRLCSVKCAPHYWNDSVVLLGDAANAIVPFYGQGTNSGFESVQLLWESIDKAADLKSALANYSSTREQDLHCISDLAWRHFTELRISARLLERAWREVEMCLDIWLGGNTWASEYSLIAFSELRYSEVRTCVSMRRRKLGQGILLVLGLSILTAVLLVPVSRW